MSGPQAEDYHLRRILPGRGGELDARRACLASRLGAPYRLGDLVPGPGSPGPASAVPAKEAVGGRLPDLHSARRHPLLARRQSVDAQREGGTYCLGVRFALGSDLHMPRSEDVSSAFE
jgi:hypothetical protein